MLHSALQICCVFVFALGLFLLALDLWTGFDRSFRYFGLSWILLSLIAGIDLWLLSHFIDILNSKGIFFSGTAMALSVSLFSLTYFLFIIHLTESKSRSALRVLTVFAAIYFLLLLVGNVFGGSFRPFFYFGWSALVLCFYGIFFIYTVYRSLFVYQKTSRKRERKVIGYHLLGFTLLCFSSLLEGMKFFGYFPSSTFLIYGILGYSVLAIIWFVEGFVFLLREKDGYYEKLKELYQDLEESKGLGMGASAATIQREIHHYVKELKEKFSQIDKKKIPEKEIVFVHRMERAVLKMENFCEHLSADNKTERETFEKVFLASLIQECIQDHFPKKDRCFQIEQVDRGLYVSGEREKLELVFVNLFKNALEAQATHVVVKSLSFEWKHLLTIEDNGQGCGKDRDQIFRAFYSTKKDEGGTGLGLPIVRSILENHGGSIRAGDSRVGQGTVFTIVLPHPRAVESREAWYGLGVLFFLDENLLKETTSVFKNAGVPYSHFTDRKEASEVQKWAYMFTDRAGYDTLPESFKNGFSQSIYVIDSELNVVRLPEDGDQKKRILSEGFLLELMRGTGVL